MKRERVNTAETELMTGSLDVSVYNMEKNLKKAVEEINELFGTDISVRFNEEIKEDEVEPDQEPETKGEDTILEEGNSSAAEDKTEEEEVVVKTEETKKEEKEGDE